MGWTVLEVLNWTTSHFKRYDIPTPRLDAEVLLADTLGIDRTRLYASFDKPLSRDELAAFRQRVKRRADREPVAYITGRKAFWEQEFEVGAGALIPRPDTETLVEHAVQWLTGKPRSHRRSPRRSLPWRPDAPGPDTGVTDDAEPQPSHDSPGATPPDPLARPHPPGERPGATPAPQATPEPPALVLDLCTGVGNIPISLALETGCRAIGVDISPRAVQFARNNVARHGLEQRVAILLGDLDAPVPRRFEKRFNIITANPPYLTPSLLERAAPEITRYEPREALLGGRDGLELCWRILQLSPRWLAPGGVLLIEIGDTTQADAVLKRMGDMGLQEGRILDDLGGNPRVVVGRLPEAPPTSAG